MVIDVRHVVVSAHQSKSSWTRRQQHQFPDGNRKMDGCLTGPGSEAKASSSLTSMRRQRILPLSGSLSAIAARASRFVGGPRGRCAWGPQPVPSEWACQALLGALAADIPHHHPNLKIIKSHRQHRAANSPSAVRCGSRPEITLSFGISRQGSEQDWRPRPAVRVAMKQFDAGWAER